MFDVSISLNLQLHNVTLALDLLTDTGLQVSNVDPQGEEITQTVHTIPTLPRAQQIKSN